LREAEKRIAGADGLRAIACLLVVWHHTAQKLNPEGQSPLISALHFMGMRGEVGVSLFFVLSGCLLSMPFWKNFVQGEHFPSLRVYALNRAARIAPAFWANLLFCTLLAFWVFDLEINWQKLLTGLFFVNSYSYLTFFPAEINGPLWSIGLEVSCYVLLPLVLYAIYKMARGAAAAIASLTGVILVLQAMNPFLILFFMTDEDSKGWQFGLDGGAKLWLPYWNIGSFFTQFLIGSLAALVIAQMKSKGRKPSQLFDFGAVATLSAAVALVLARLNPGNPDPATQQPYVAPYFAIFAGGALVCLSHSTFVAKLLDNRLFSRIAQLSFGIYLWHVVVIEVIARKFVPEYVYGGVQDVGQWIALSAIVLAVSVAIAAVSWKWFESPIIAAARKVHWPSSDAK